jgi:ubiquinone/menaquinone biosynthesis C-methylase UbiE
MTSKSQREAFIQYEADAWFERNLVAIKHYNVQEDPVVKLLNRYSLQPKNLIELGCSAGHRLNGIKASFPDCDVSGIEPSKKAIEKGKSTYRSIKFHQGVADNLLGYDSGSMDVVIVGFIFCLIDREVIFKTVSEIDRILKNHGSLILIDFFSESTLKLSYKHISDFDAYTYKQNYEDIFISSRMYYLLDKSTLNHTTKRPDASEDYYNKYSISLLKKDAFASYK